MQHIHVSCLIIKIHIFGIHGILIPQKCHVTLNISVSSFSTLWAKLCPSPPPHYFTEVITLK